MDPKQRKQKALEKLDGMYSGDASTPVEEDEVTEHISSNLSSVSSEYSRTTGFGMKNIMSMMMVFILIVFVITIGTSVLGTVDAYSQANSPTLIIESTVQRIGPMVPVLTVTVLGIAGVLFITARKW
jgi:hypothetical protein